MMRWQKKKCTKIVVGKIIDIRSRGSDGPTLVRVEYVYGGETYVIKETLKLKSEAIRWHWLIIGQRKIPRIGIRKIGDAVNVVVNPNKPSCAYIEGNDGITNC